MVINDTLKKRKMTKYELAKLSGVPYTTISDICSEKAQLEKCSAETLYKLSKALDISMETMLEPCFVKRCSFELYKSNVCHDLKKSGDIDFIVETLEKDSINEYYTRKWYPECFYLLAMLDYISRLNKVPLCDKYDGIRKCHLKETIYPVGIRMAASVDKSRNILDEAAKDAIPEFMQFNIVENEVRNVI